MIRDVAALPPPPATRAEAPPADKPVAPPAKPEPVAAGSAPSIRNPHLRIDSMLNLVVLEFRDTVGEVRNTIPSPREIAAYRSAGPDEPTPPPQPDLDVEG
ncbi:MAG TPA: hypothetical protein VGN83_06585 [Falsiroseomonas sp.]|jgi:hypothetical protein|nr:hypothetical protein [Falsiroseomonas sp.]